MIRTTMEDMLRSSASAARFSAAFISPGTRTFNTWSLFMLTL
jgi:hypothetical protein